MTKPVVSLVHSLPALDMSLALLLELRKHRPDRAIVSLLKLGHATRIPTVEFLFDVMCRVSDRIVLVGSSPLYVEAAAIAERHGRRAERLNAWRPPGLLPGLRRIAWSIKTRRDRREVSRFVRTLPERATLLRSHADVDAVAEALVAAVRRRGGESLAYLEGCYPPRDALPLAYFRSPRSDLCDRFLLSTEGHRAALEGVGYRSASVIGYTKLYPAWREAVLASPEVLELGRQTGRMTVSVFTRGETPGAGPQIMPAATFEALLADLLAAVDERLGEPRVLIKPHPAQEVSVIARLIEGRASTRLTTLHPSQLAAVSDLVITTWSTSTVDALAFGVPCIEYFTPNDYFRQIYPHGSSFRQLGILWAEDGTSFRRCLDAVMDGSYRPPDAERVFGQRADLSIFGV